MPSLVIERREAIKKAIKFLVASLFVAFVGGWVLTLLFFAKDDAEARLLAANPDLVESAGLRYLVITEEARPRYPEGLEVLERELGHLPEWRDAIIQHGAKAIAVLWTAHEKPSRSYQLRTALKSLVLGKPEPNAQERTLWVLGQISKYGESYLRAYEIDRNGWAVFQTVRGGLSLVERYAVPGMINAEAKYTRGDPISASEYAHAALEAGTIALGVGTFARLATASRATRAAVYAKSAATPGIRGYLGRTAAMLPPELGATALKYGTIGLGVYAVTKHPGLVSSFFGGVAKTLGYNELVGQTVGWSLVVLAVLWTIYPLLRILQMLYGLLRRKPKPVVPAVTT